MLDVRAVNDGGRLLERLKFQRNNVGYSEIIIIIIIIITSETGKTILQLYIAIVWTHLKLEKHTRLVKTSLLCQAFQKR